MGAGWQRWALLAAAGAAILALIVWLARAYGPLEDQGEQIRLVWGVVILVALGSAALVRWRARPGQALRQALIWIAAGIALVLGYGYRHELGAVADRLLGELSPGRGMRVSAEAVSFPAAADGHFRVEATVDGVAMRMLVDTGASVVVLSEAQARRIGIDRAKLAYTIWLDTANGRTMGAPIRLGEIRIGPIAVGGVRAVVLEQPMGDAILGQSFLERLGGYTVSKRTLTLRP